MPLFRPRIAYGDSVDVTTEATIENASNPTATAQDHSSVTEENNANEQHTPPSPTPKRNAKYISCISFPCPPSPYLSAPITLIVGGLFSRAASIPQRTFYVHADLLISISPFFRAAFDTHNNQAGFAESTTLSMHLPEERADDVAYLLQWLYTASETVTGLRHALIDIPIKKMEQYKRERTVAQSAERDGAITQLISPRPRPPAFGPLIRLYLLADRLNVKGGLKTAICKRVDDVGTTAAAVPGKDDVWRLWDGMPKLARGAEEAAGAVGSDSKVATRWPIVSEEEGTRACDEGDLKKVVLSMYANMRGWAVFEAANENDEGFDWHPLFMRTLVIRLLREKREAGKPLGRED